MYEPSQERLDILKKIDEYERKRWFNKDVENDPPTIPLTEDKVDYLYEKPFSKFKMKFANLVARHHINNLLKFKRMIISEVRGIPNFKSVPGAAILTCNHFNAFDNFAVYKAIEKHLKNRELYKVIREGNYTNFPGLYGWFFRNCNTLPLSSNFRVMKLFMNAIKVLLSRGEKILFYPEQGMWWNYQKPRPLEKGAFHFAATHNVPIIPIFITMSDSCNFDGDGFLTQEYTVHILRPIYPKKRIINKRKL